ncbi:biotin/lipoyl-containing protein [Peptostreptococcaceae bacterium AGR-M142]
MTRNFNVTVNGETYSVEVEEIKADGSVATQTVSRPAPVSKPAPKPAAPAKKAVPKAAPKQVTAGASTIDAPMPGTILDIKVKEGDSVKEGQVIVILEAMKMENELMAPADGVIASINVEKGASVNPGEVLVSIN